eukprot:scaffold133066_cov37-Prasinocladus_malaysianus.AAC.1
MDSNQSAPKHAFKSALRAGPHHDSIGMCVRPRPSCHLNSNLHWALTCTPTLRLIIKICPQETYELMASIGLPQKDSLLSPMKNHELDTKITPICTARALRLGTCCQPRTLRRPITLKPD